jgi:hypothetical protein
MNTNRRNILFAALAFTVSAQLFVSGGSAEAAGPTSYVVWANAGYANTGEGVVQLEGGSAINASRLGVSPKSREWLSGSQSRGGHLLTPLDMVMDSARGFVYWVDDYGVERAPIGGCLPTKRCNTNLYGTYELTGKVAPATEYVTGISLDVTRNYLYVGIYNTELKTYQIIKLKADGSSNPSDALVLSSAQDIAASAGFGSIVVFEGKLYFTVDGRSAESSISWASLTTSDHGDLITSENPLVDRPWGLAVDVKNRSLYWANWTDNSVNAGSISKWDFGTNLASSLYTNTNCPTDLHGPAGVAIDSTTGKIYWGSYNGGDPVKGSIAADTCSAINTTGVVNRQQSTVAILKSPTLVSAPKISFKRTKHALLKCTTGTWLADVGASRLFQAPETSKFTYQWKHNGKTIKGSSATLRAKKPGSYRCSVKGTNYAGSVTVTSGSLKVTSNQAK